jgi:transcription antitermination factor NusG
MTDWGEYPSYPVNSNGREMRPRDDVQPTTKIYEEGDKIPARNGMQVVTGTFEYKTEEVNGVPCKVLECVEAGRIGIGDFTPGTMEHPDFKDGAKTGRFKKTPQLANHYKGSLGVFEDYCKKDIEINLPEGSKGIAMAAPTEQKFSDYCKEDVEAEQALQFGVNYAEIEARVLAHCQCLASLEGYQNTRINFTVQGNDSAEITVEGSLDGKTYAPIAAFPASQAAIYETAKYIDADNFREVTLPDGSSFRLSDPGSPAEKEGHTMKYKIVKNLQSIEDLRGIEIKPEVEHLTLVNCPRLQTLKGFSGQLKTLELVDLPELHNIDHVPRPEQLRVTNCPKLKEVKEKERPWFRKDDKVEIYYHIHGKSNWISSKVLRVHEDATGVHGCSYDVIMKLGLTAGTEVSGVPQRPDRIRVPKSIQPERTKITASRADVCKTCGREVTAGGEVYWAPKRGVIHVHCYEKQGAPQQFKVGDRVLFEYSNYGILEGDVVGLDAAKHTRFCRIKWEHKDGCSNSAWVDVKRIKPLQKAEAKTKLKVGDWVEAYSGVLKKWVRGQIHQYLPRAAAPYTIKACDNVRIDRFAVVPEKIRPWRHSLKFKVGDTVRFRHKRLGWLLADVIAIDPSVTNGRYRVKWKDDNVSPETIWVAGDAIRPAAAQFKVGDIVEVSHHGGEVYRAKITRIDDDGKPCPIRVEYIGDPPPNSNYDWCEPRILRKLEEKQEGRKFKIGDIVEAKVPQDGWYRAEITAVLGGATTIPYRVEYQEGPKKGFTKWHHEARIRYPQSPEEAPAVEVYPFAVSVEDARKANKDRWLPVGVEVLKDVAATLTVIPVEPIELSEWSVHSSDRGEICPPPPSDKYWTRSWHPEETEEVEAIQIEREEYLIWGHDFSPYEEHAQTVWHGYRLKEDPPPEHYAPGMPTLYTFLTRPRG